MRYWANIDSANKIVCVESYSHNQELVGKHEITRDEFYAFIENLPTPTPETTLPDKIQAIESRLSALEKTTSP